MSSLQQLFPNFPALSKTYITQLSKVWYVPSIKGKGDNAEYALSENEASGGAHDNISLDPKSATSDNQD